jgi:glycosyltransferase involved in cell wall biosynthesis
VIAITDNYEMKKRKVVVFSPLGQLKFGTSIRSTYLINGLDSRGLLSGRYERELASKYIISDREKAKSFINLYKLPSVLNKSDTVLFEGLPNASNKARSKVISKLLDYAKRNGKKIILDLYDDPEFQKRDIKGEEVNDNQLFYIKELFFEYSDKITFPSASMRDYYVKEGQIPEEKTAVLPNASDPVHFKGLSLPDTKRIGILSGIGKGRGLDLLLDAFDMVRDEILDVELRIGCSVVTKSDKDFVTMVSNRYRNDNVSIQSDVTYLTAPDFLRECSLCVIPHRKSFYMDIATPIKLFDYMASGRPVITTDCVETAKIVKDEGCGLITGFSAEELSKGIITLLRDRKSMELYGRQGRDAIEKRHSWSHRLENLIEIITSLS